ncbi:5-oxoprolinase subunit B family protein [Nocardioides gilvus]|uniref:5-oxoprolinase subunit B family protein n=1 Tax=Nocardioides gilvus TaxID=1735589 RepID=UPI000D7496A0|nr:allophanate hydrolase subunit 1 [Nocardioides gilvus]
MDRRSVHSDGSRTRRGRTLAVGPHALLVEVSGADEARVLADWIRAGPLVCDDVVPAASTVLLDGVADLDRARSIVENWSPEQAVAQHGALVRIPVHYDGEDLGRVADLWGVSLDEVVGRHTGCEFVSSFTGFAPGFAYLTGLPPAWAVSRLESPRAHVPAGSVGLADAWCGIYPTSSPGGWLLLGRTDAVLWDLDRSGGPALLPPGTRVRFVVA